MAAGNTYEAIASTTLGSDTATVSFTSIPSTYTDLVLVFVGAVASAGWEVGLRFNNDSGTNYSTTILYGTGSAAGSERLTSNSLGILDSWTGGNHGTTLGNNNAIFQIMNYANTTTYKTTLTRGNSNDTTSSQFVGASVGLWRSTSAINRVDFISYPTTPIDIKSGSTISLYGILAAT